MRHRCFGFYASQVLDIAKLGTVGDKGEEKANHIRVKVEKNKIAPPFRKAEFDIRFGEGIDRAGEILTLALEYEIVQKKGSFYSYGDRKWQGQENARDGFYDDPVMIAEIEEKIMKMI